MVARMTPTKLKEKLEDLRQKKLTLELRADELKEAGSIHLVCRSPAHSGDETPGRTWICYKKRFVGYFFGSSSQIKYRKYWFQCQHCDNTMILKDPA